MPEDLRLQLVKRILKYARGMRTKIGNKPVRYGSQTYYEEQGAHAAWQDMIGYLENLQRVIHDDIGRKVVYNPNEGAENENEPA